MAIPRAAIGAGIGAGAGALAGAGLGALSSRENRGQGALRGALAGGTLGALGGGLAHGAARTGQLLREGYVPHARMAEAEARLGGALRAASPTEANLFRRGQQAKGALHEGFFGSQGVKDIAAADPFHGVQSAGEMKNIYRQQARALHPDRGGDPEAFTKMKDMYERHLATRFPEKAASIVFWSSFSDELQKVAAKDPTSLKVPKLGTNLKGMERYTANPGHTPITEPGKENASKATVSGLGRMNDTVGRSATSANPTPQPPPVTT